MANGTKERNTSPITIEDEINEFSEKPVQGKTLYKKLKELEDGILPDASEASAGDALVLDEDKNPKWAPPDALPAIASGDAGKVLKVNSGESGVEWGDVPNELPSVTGNAGKVLKVNSGATGTEWGDVPNELPSVTGNAGKVLKVNSGATGVEWGNAGGDVLYNHLIYFFAPNFTIHLSIINKNSTEFTVNTLLDFLSTLYVPSNYTWQLYPCSGSAQNNTTNKPRISTAIGYTSSGQESKFTINYSEGAFATNVVLNPADITYFNDKVVTI